MSKQRSLSVLSTAATFALALACGGADTGPDNRGVPDATSSQTNAAPREGLREGGTFTFPLDQVPTNFNYHHLDGTLFDNFRVMAALLPATYDNDATAAPVWNRALLASEPILVTEPRQVVTYQINPAAIWYDGTPITWEDFHWQWRASNGTDKRYQIAASNGYEDIESVARGRDDREVIVTYKHPFADWQSIFNQFFPAATNKDPGIFNEGWLERPLTTAGPFKVASINQTTKTITLVRNEKWWGNTARLDTIVFRVIEADAQIDALANGEIDAMDIGPDANKYARARGIDGIEIRTAGGPNFRHITINGTGAILQDVRVRKAVAMGMDRSAIARAMLGPLGSAPQTLDNHIFMTNQSGYRDNSGEIGRQNPERARQLLDEAGWSVAAGGSVRMKDGKPLEIGFTIPAGVATSRQESELVQNMLGQIGVAVRINTVPLPDFFAKYITPGQYDVTVFSWIGTAYPISSSKSIYANPVRLPDGTMDVRQNYARVGSAQIDSLYARANQELSRSAAIDIANRIDSLIWDEVHSLTMYQRPEIIATKAGLANFGAFGFASPWVYEDIGWRQ
jgi:peptide/nickel transport system substrate-binding protein